MKAVITTSSFATFDQKPLKELKANNIEYITNPHGRKLTGDEVVALAKDADGLIAGTEPLNQDTLERLSSLKVISRCGAGLDNVDLEKASSMEIKVFNTPFGPTLAVAELTVGLILNLLRKINLMDRELRSGIWKKRMGNLLSGKNVGIIGFGRIGQKVAELLNPIGARIAYHDLDASIQTTPYMKLEELLAWADIITLHCSGATDNKPLIGMEQLDQMHPESLLLNLARGGLVDEEALMSALSSRRLAGAALDVFSEEPYSGNLSNMENVIITPHIGSYAKEGRIQMELDAVHNLIQGLRT